MRGGVGNRLADQPVAAWLRDLRPRGLLESTLVLWSGEFGRTPTAEIRGGRFADAGRDHGPCGVTSGMAGGGVQRGLG